MDDRSMQAEVARLDGRIEKAKTALKKIAELLKHLDTRVSLIETHLKIDAPDLDD